MSKKKLVVLDGYSLLYRAFYGIKALTNSEGIHTNAIHGFIKMFVNTIEEFDPEYAVVAFDKGKTFRHESYADYKAGRKAMPPEMKEQVPYVREIIESLGVQILELEGFEADDIIGTLAKKADENDIVSYVVTGDKDALQLASENTNIVITKKGVSNTVIYNRDAIVEEYGIEPKQLIDVKGLMGDKSDNIPGVPGIGEKKALKYIVEHGSLETLLANVETVRGKDKEKLTENMEDAVFSKKLATIETEVPIEIDFDTITFKDSGDVKKTTELFYKLQLKSLAPKVQEVFGNGEEVKEEKEEVKFSTVNTFGEIKKCINSLDGKVYLTYLLNNEENRLFDLEVEKIFIKCKDDNFVLDLFVLTDEEKKECFEMLFSSELEIVCHSAKKLYNILRKMDVKYKEFVYDTEIAAYLVDPGKKGYELNSLVEAFYHLGVDGEDDESKVRANTYIERLEEDMQKKIEEQDMSELLYEIEMPLIDALSSVEVEGFRVDKSQLEELKVKFAKEIEEKEKVIYELAGEEFKIKSPKQLGKILFEKLDLPVIKKTKTGYSTNAEVLEKLEGMHPIINEISYYRQITKIYSTYVEGLLEVIEEDGRIRSTLNQTVTTTGRLSSTDPNLQNIPIKYEMGRDIRKVFIPQEDSVLLAADYSQIELRVLAHIADDENMIDAFKHSADVHTKTAAEVFDVDESEVTPYMRSSAKAVNFGIVYGMGDFSLAKDIGVSRDEAKRYIENYLGRYPGVKEYLDNIIKKAKEDGYVTTIFNRIRYIQEIKSSKKMVVALGERLAMNTPIQGSAADIIKIAMVKVHKRLEKEGLSSKIILQVHDELILNVKNDELDKVRVLVQEEMENALELKVPLKVDASTGNTWYEAK